jgi:hypothetical protein
MCTFQNLRVIAGNIHHLTVRIDKNLCSPQLCSTVYFMADVDIVMPPAAGRSVHVLLFDSL